MAILTSFGGATTAPVVAVGSAIGPTVQNNADAAVVAGQPVRVLPGGGFGLASAATGAATGIAGVGTAPGYAGLVVTAGALVLTDWTAATGAQELQPGYTYYLDYGTVGRISIYAPTGAGSVVQALGVASSADTLVVALALPILL